MCGGSLAQPAASCDRKAVRRPRRRTLLFGHWAPVAAAVLTGVVVFAAATQGGPNVREARPLIEIVDKLAASAGLGLSEVRLVGHRQTDDRAVFDALNLANAQSLLGFDAQAARRRIEQLPWVRSATIQRSFPDAITVTIAERVAFAVWEQGGRRHLIDDTGRVLGPAPATETDLPVLRGEGAASAASQLLSLVSDHPQVLRRMAHAQRVEDRRWSLVLDEGVVVHLPVEGEGEALWRLTMPRTGGALIDRRVAAIDLRSPTHVVLTPLGSKPIAGAAPQGRGVVIGSARGGGPETWSE